MQRELSLELGFSHLILRHLLAVRRAQDLRAGGN
jgi:hypothetical protein